jgi:hypothetical protein
MDTVAIFCALDDFCQWFEPWWEQRLLELAPKRRRRRAGLCLSEVKKDRVRLIFYSDGVILTGQVKL